MGHIGIVILAAGASTRLGQPKQLLLYQGQSLIEHIATVALASPCQPVVVVLGAYASQITPKLKGYNIQIAYNQQWSTGMASALKCGLATMQGMVSNLDAVIVLLCDQPFVSPDFIHELIKAYKRNNNSIIASQYGNVIGVPALFDQTLFPELTQLEGNRGAQKIILNSDPSRVFTIPFPKGLIDIDAPEDLNNLR